MLAHQVVQGVHSTPVSDTQVLVSEGQEPGEEVLRDQDQILSQDHAYRLPVLWIMNITARQYYANHRHSTLTQITGYNAGRETHFQSVFITELLASD